MDIGIILAGYPKYHEWHETIKARVDTLAAYQFSGTRASGGNTSDSTGRLALLAADNSQLIRKVEICGQFVNGLIDQRERAILIGVWRATPWRLISESVDMPVKEVMAIWQKMIGRAKELYVGIA